MVKAVKLETENVTKDYVTVSVYSTELRHEEYNIKNDTAKEMHKGLILSIRASNQKLIDIKKKFTLCKDLAVLDPFSIPEAISVDFFTKCKDNLAIGKREKITIRIP
jgi:hypothetical protein